MNSCCNECWTKNYPGCLHSKCPCHETRTNVAATAPDVAAAIRPEALARKAAEHIAARYVQMLRVSMAGQGWRVIDTPDEQRELVAEFAPLIVGIHVPLYEELESLRKLLSGALARERRLHRIVMESFEALPSDFDSNFDFLPGRIAALQRQLAERDRELATALAIARVENARAQAELVRQHEAAEQMRREKDAEIERLKSGLEIAKLHKPVTNEMHDPANGLISGFCARCATPWPCVYAPERPPNVERRATGNDR